MGIFQRIWQWLDDRTGLPSSLMAVAHHAVPPITGWRAWTYVLGSATLLCFLIQVATGIVLATAYVPSTEHAYQSLQFITHEATFGRLVRGLHAYSASAMILFIGLHMIQVFLIAAYKFPRELNWLSGVGLFALTLGMVFTGQLIRWDADGLWSVFIVAQQAERVPFIGGTLAHFLIAGKTIGGATLTRFYALHVFFLPALILMLVGLHLYLVLHHGISEFPRTGRPVDPRTYRKGYRRYLARYGQPFWPDAAWRDVVFGVCLIVGLFLLALILGPPELKGLPDPTNVDAYPRPGWYFLWYFALFALMPPQLEDYAIVLVPLIAGLVLILIPLVFNRGERSPLRRPWALAFVLFMAVTIGTLWQLGVKSPWSPDFSARPLPAPMVTTSGDAAVQGARLFYKKGCEYCHAIGNQGGHRGPELSNIGNQLTSEQMIVRILNGGKIMPAYAGNLDPEALNALVAFLKTQRQPCQVRGCGR
jgi:ubiquinol-cytochrome c reductase cytochrome b subunit